MDRLAVRRLAASLVFFSFTFWLLYRSKQSLIPASKASLESTSSIRCNSPKPAKRVAIIGQFVIF